MSVPSGFDSIQILCKPVGFVPSLYFSTYDYWELYDSDVKYHQGLHDFRSIRGLLPYKWVLYEFNKEERYAVAHRIYRTDYLKTLMHLCPCHICTSVIYRMFGFRRSCDCCSGCIRAAAFSNPLNVSEKFVKKAEFRRDGISESPQWLWTKMD